MKAAHAAALALVSWYLMLLGAGCLVIVVLTHVCEAFHLLPVMGWGLKGSPGHYLDLSAAVLGLVLLSTGYFLASTARRKQKRPIRPPQPGAAIVRKLEKRKGS